MTIATKKARLEGLVRQAGLRATSPRRRILEALEREACPLSAKDLARKLKGRVDAVTVYRTLEGLSRVGIVRRTDFRHGHAEYEFTAGRKHHHHLVCETCGRVEDFSGCGYDALVEQALKETRGFVAIQNHAIELFGSCRTCVRRETRLA